MIDDDSNYCKCSKTINLWSITTTIRRNILGRNIAHIKVFVLFNLDYLVFSSKNLLLSISSTVFLIFCDEVSFLFLDTTVKQKQLRDLILSCCSFVNMLNYSIGHIFHINCFLHKKFSLIFCLTQPDLLMHNSFSSLLFNTRRSSFSQSLNVGGT